MKPMYTTSVKASGGRDGHVKSEDGIIDLEVATPKELGGEGGRATNPEQLFASGYSACFDGALNLMLSKAKKEAETSVTANVTIGKDEADNGLKLAVRLDVEISGMEKEEAQKFAEQAHAFCPYSKAIRDNVEVTIIIV